MILYSDRDDHYSQRVRIVLAEKDITAEIKESKPEETPEDILSISPYHKLPILVDRDLAIHDPSVMMIHLYCPCILLQELIVEHLCLELIENGVLLLIL